MELPGAMRIHEALDRRRVPLDPRPVGPGRARRSARGRLARRLDGITDDPDDDSPTRRARSVSARRRRAASTSRTTRTGTRSRSPRASARCGPSWLASRSSVSRSSLQASDGGAVPMTFGPGKQPGTASTRRGVGRGGLPPRGPPATVLGRRHLRHERQRRSLPRRHPGLPARLRRDVVKGRERVRILPFDGQPLLPGWNDQPFEIEGAAATYVLRESSSGARVQPRAGGTRPGAPAGSAGGPHRHRRRELARTARRPTCGAGLATVRPLVFAVQTGGLNEAPALRRHHLMADWAASSGGVYRYATSRADIEAAFDHLATWLRRPAGYRLTVETSAEELPPPEPGAALGRGAATRARDGRASCSPGDVAVELILDTSGSMLKSIGGERRIDIAKRVLVELVTHDLPAGIPVALRVFEDEPDSCDTELLVPLAPLDPATMAPVIREREVPAHAARPWRRDRVGGGRPRGGRPTCRGGGQRWRERAARATRKPPSARVQEAGVDVRVNVVGLALDRRDRRVSERMAELGGGAYLRRAQRRRPRRGTQGGGQRTLPGPGRGRSGRRRRRCRRHAGVGCRRVRTSWRSRSSPRSVSTRSTGARGSRRLVELTLPTSEEAAAAPADAP